MPSSVSVGPASLVARYRSRNAGAASAAREGHGDCVGHMGAFNHIACRDKVGVVRQFPSLASSAALRTQSVITELVRNGP
jgi:hypothetical protein